MQNIHDGTGIMSQKNTTQDEMEQKILQHTSGEDRLV